MNSDTFTLPQWFQGILTKYNRIALTGGPRTGKTTIARLVLESEPHTDFSRPTWSTDDAIPLGWEGSIDATVTAAQRFSHDYVQWLIEGVQVARALRRGMECDIVVYLLEPIATLTRGQLTMAKGIETVMQQVEEMLEGSTPVLRIEHAWNLEPS